MPHALAEVEKERRGVLLGVKVPEGDPVVEGDPEGDFEVMGELVGEGQGVGVLSPTVGVEAFMGEGESREVRLGVEVADWHTLAVTVPNSEALSTREGLLLPLPLGGWETVLKPVIELDTVEEGEE